MNSSRSDLKRRFTKPKSQTLKTEDEKEALRACTFSFLRIVSLFDHQELEENGSSYGRKNNLRKI